jgi:SAM-dependent methyltransferase
MKARLLALLQRASGQAKEHRLKIKFFESLQNDIAALTFPRAKSHWAGYYGTADHNWFRTDLVPADWQKKQETVTGILSDLRPKSVLDVGANTGHYARIAAGQGARVTACELDVSALTVCYQQTRKDGLNILPLVTNVLSTSPAAGRGAVALSPPIERLHSELVMGLALVHHIVAAERIRINRLSEIFAAMTNRWLLLEFVPPLPPKIGASTVPGLDDFTAGDLEDSLKTHFASVRSFASYPMDRQLFVCEK